MPMRRYLKKAIVDEAVQWTGDNADEIASLVGEHAVASSRIPAFYRDAAGRGVLWIEKNDAWANVNVGDYIVCEPYGEGGFYPSAQSVFERGHEMESSTG